ncbi:hypothetical protein PR048_031664 [Dryococelus australis]|uniref:Uncharacterized protein n=1 Tax=Dryococelus australis TaxID=614101 RepID=A0ABQ9G5X1_9NEOP|nr:hypothetical protein PR048_031664 [Dryococelus australis]
MQSKAENVSFQKLNLIQQYESMESSKLSFKYHLNINVLASHRGEPGSIPGGGHRIFASGNRAGRCRRSTGFLGDLPFPLPLHSGATSYSFQSPSSALKTSMLRAAQISSFTHYITSLELYEVGAALTERLDCSPLTKAVHGLSPAGSLLDFRKWESCRTMPLIGGCSMPHFTLTGTISVADISTAAVRGGIIIILSLLLLVEVVNPYIYTRMESVVRGWGEWQRTQQAATVAERLACSPFTKADRVQSPAGSPARRNRAGRCRWLAAFLGDLPFSPPFSFRRCSILTSIALIGSQDFATPEELRRRPVLQDWVSINTFAVESHSGNESSSLFPTVSQLRQVLSSNIGEEPGLELGGKIKTSPQITHSVKIFRNVYWPEIFVNTPKIAGSRREPRPTTISHVRCQLKDTQAVYKTCPGQPRANSRLAREHKSESRTVECAITLGQQTMKNHPRMKDCGEREVWARAARACVHVCVITHRRDANELTVRAPAAHPRFLVAHTQAPRYRPPNTQRQQA